MKHSEYTDWLYGLKANDSVHLRNTRSQCAGVIIPVERVTKTLVIVGGMRFSKAHGQKIGRRNRSVWDGIDEIRPVTLDVVNRIERERLVRFIESVKWDELHITSLEEIESTVRKDRNGQ